MNPTTPSRNVARWSGRASKPTPRFSSPGYVVERPWHRLAAPVDARTRSTGYFTPRTRARNHGSATSIQLRWPNEVDYLRNKTKKNQTAAREGDRGEDALILLVQLHSLRGKENGNERKKMDIKLVPKIFTRLPHTTIKRRRR